MKVFWSASAEQDRADIFDFIAQDSPRAAVRMDALFAARARRLAAHPLIGRAGTVAGTRELIVHESYRMVYECRDDAVWILALVHTARMWPTRQR
ncbi:MAG: type II toxin-antitoxin system RelE/ParE family toxin [Burkholderiaceae bacterium]